MPSMKGPMQAAKVGHVLLFTMCLFMLPYQSGCLCSFASCPHCPPCRSGTSCTAQVRYKLKCLLTWQLLLPHAAST